ncbi:MAG: hypothetical protein H7Y20_16600, partial [Bryobacteraceae bacterium]|nr:hypothetical protein [Bryobacteraceae bacterium]
GRSRPVLIATALATLTAIGFLWFPGHTFLQSDTQIYIPILEHIVNPAVLDADPVAVRPHVAFTIYDEIALTLRRVTGLDFSVILQTQQVIFRALGLLGLFLIAKRAGLSDVHSLTAAALVSLGATVNGPAVLTVEYEPVPRAFALPLTVLSAGLLAHERRVSAYASAALAWALHPPTAMPFCVFLAALAVYRRQWLNLAVLSVGPILIAISIAGQPVSAEHATLLGRIDPWLEAIQRMRSSYNWVDTWIGRYWLHFTLLFIASMVGFWRLRHTFGPDLKMFLVALPVIGCLAVPISWLLLDRMRLFAAAQYQPCRYLLYLPMLAALSCGISGLRAASGGRVAEAALFLVVPFAIPLAPDVTGLSAIHLLLATCLALIASLGTRFHSAACAVLLAFALYPTVGHVSNYPANPATAELNELIGWAKSSTPREAIFQFADVRRGPEPGVFRANAQRAIYADWKGGGQVNFLPEFARLWAERWKQIERPQPLHRYRELGIDFVVFSSQKSPRNQPAVYSNHLWTVFRVSK